jgi:hypothetical protein
MVTVTQFVDRLREEMIHAVLWLPVHSKTGLCPTSMEMFMPAIAIWYLPLPFSLPPQIWTFFDELCMEVSLPLNIMAIYHTFSIAIPHGSVTRQSSPCLVVQTVAQFC